jgi:hypothetical protein
MLRRRLEGKHQRTPPPVKGSGDKAQFVAGATTEPIQLRGRPAEARRLTHRCPPPSAPTIAQVPANARLLQRLVELEDGATGEGQAAPIPLAVGEALR